MATAQFRFDTPQLPAECFIIVAFEPVEHAEKIQTPCNRSGYMLNH
jgi:hypothetical protein